MSRRKTAGFPGKKKIKRLEGEETLRRVEVSMAMRCPGRVGGFQGETYVSKQNCRFPRREEDLEIQKDTSKTSKRALEGEGVS